MLDRASLAAAIDNTNASMALEGYALTPQMAALQGALLAGRATIDEIVRFALLSAKAVSTREALLDMQADDPKRADYEARSQQISAEMRELAQRFGYELSQIFP